MKELQALGDLAGTFKIALELMTDEAPEKEAPVWAVMMFAAMDQWYSTGLAREEAQRAADKVADMYLKRYG